MMQFAPESTCMMIASDILAENAPLSLPALRERINTPDGMVNTDLLFSRLIDNGTTPDPARIDMAMGILGPVGGQRADGRLLPDHRPEGHAQPRHGRR